MLKICLILTLALVQTNAFGIAGLCNFDAECKPSEYCVVDKFNLHFLLTKG